jgi:hypothetical protein
MAQDLWHKLTLWAKIIYCKIKNDSLKTIKIIATSFIYFLLLAVKQNIVAHLSFPAKRVNQLPFSATQWQQRWHVSGSTLVGCSIARKY